MNAITSPTTVQDDRAGFIERLRFEHRCGASGWCPVAPQACQIAGITVRTLQRWKADDGDGLISGDGRPQALRRMPCHALTPAEREQVLRVANEPRFAAVPPARIVPMLADEGIYLASESSFARILRTQGQNAHRGRARAPRPVRPPTTHIASAPSEVWCWDMTYLPAVVVGRWYLPVSDPGSVQPQDHRLGGA
jgi:putative transposase